LASLTGTSVKTTYKDLLTISGTTAGEGLTSSKKTIYDGLGNTAPMVLSTSAIGFLGAVTVGNDNYTGNDSNDFIVYGTSGGSSSTDEPHMKYDASARELKINDGDVIVDGDIHCEYIKLVNSGYNSGTATSAFVMGSDGSLSILRDVQTKGAVKFQEAGYDDLVVKASTGVFEKGDGTKGKVTLGDSEVTLSKGSSALVTAKDDGTLRVTSVSSLPGSPSNGDMVNKDGAIYIAG